MMSPPNFHSIKYLKQLLLATSLVALTACGGGGGGGDDDDDTPPVVTNKNPTVSISSDSSVTEGGDLVLQVTATDSDGTIAVTHGSKHQVQINTYRQRYKYTYDHRA